jgi:hypothetical protein
LALEATLAIVLPGHHQRVGNDLRQDLQCPLTIVYKAAVPKYPHLCIVLRCMPSRHHCQPVAVVDLSVSHSILQLNPESDPARITHSPEVQW